MNVPVILFFGKPCAGKGTRSKLVAEKLGIEHISTGDIIREELKVNSNLKSIVDSGNLVDDLTVTELLKKRLAKEDCKKGFILDGYPRNIEQVYILNNILKELKVRVTKVIECNISDDLVIKRMLGRKECTKCSASYSFDSPPKCGSLCDKCGSEVVSRSDDTEEVIKTRLKVYKDAIDPMLEYYYNINVLQLLDSSVNPEHVLNLIDA